MCDDGWFEDGWGPANARVACRQLGYPVIGARALYGTAVPDGTGRIWLDEVDCYGTESSLFQCYRNFVGFHDCEHYEDAGVECRK